MPPDFDIVIAGSGFAGSLMAMVARRLGYRVLLIERGRHPRFAIGESSTPLANLLLRRLATKHNLPEVAALSRYGTWKSEHPRLSVGLKRGFSFFHHLTSQPWEKCPDASNEFMLAASSRDELADTHWYRPELDQFLFHLAHRLGADTHEETRIEAVVKDPRGWKIRVLQRGVVAEVHAQLFLDATGPGGILARHFGLLRTTFPGYPQTMAVFAHFKNVRRWEECVALNPDAPFPADQAALHHVFDRGWIWVLRFDHGITSAGVSLQDPSPKEQTLPAETVWKQIMQMLPSVRGQFENATPATDFHRLDPLPSLHLPAGGENWMLMPGSTGFVDPLLSTGFSHSLLGIERIAHRLATDGPSGDWTALAGESVSDLQATADLVGALHRAMARPGEFQALLKLYFAVVHHQESQTAAAPDGVGLPFFHRENTQLAGFLEQMRAPEQFNALRGEMDRILRMFGG